MVKITLKKSHSNYSQFNSIYADCFKDKQLRKKTILLVDDEKGIRNFVSSVLSILGYEVKEVSEGEQALNLINKYESKFNLLITDMKLPGINGYDLASVILKINPELQILFI